MTEPDDFQAARDAGLLARFHDWLAGHPEGAAEAFFAEERIEGDEAERLKPLLAAAGALRKLPAEGAPPPPMPAWTTAKDSEAGIRARAVFRIVLRKLAVAAAFMAAVGLVYRMGFYEGRARPGANLPALPGVVYASEQLVDGVSYRTALDATHGLISIYRVDHDGAAVAETLLGVADIGRAIQQLAPRAGPRDQPIKFHDLAGDPKVLPKLLDLSSWHGKLVLLFGVNTPADPETNGWLLAFRGEGDLLWGYHGGGDYRKDGEEYRRNYGAQQVLAEDLDGDGEREILFSAGHNPYHPNQISIFKFDGAAGRRQVEFWNAGTAVVQAVEDFDGDGEREVLIGGSQNFYGEAFLAVLKLSALPGGGGPDTLIGVPCVDEERRSEQLVNGREPGQTGLVRLFRLPNTFGTREARSISNDRTYRAWLHDATLFKDKKEFEFTVTGFAPGAAGFTAMDAYIARMTYGFRLTDIQLYDPYKRARTDRLATLRGSGGGGFLTRSLEDETAALRSVKEWNGQQWVESR